MLSKKQHKVIVIGLPKTGTSTLAVMLRMLNYRVTGPDGQFQQGDEDFLKMKYQNNDGFQDYPWCFEWQRFFDDECAKFIVLKRDPESWWKSFYDSYGRKKTRYLSYPYMQISKEEKNKRQFLSYFEAYYKGIEGLAANYPDRFLNIDIKTFEWTDLCDFLDEDPPRDLLGRLVKKPHVNKEKAKVSRTKRYKVMNNLRKTVIRMIGAHRWNALVLFLRKNGLI